MNTTLFSDFYREYLGLDDRMIWNGVHVCRCKYIALMNGELAGYCKVSDVISGFGNLVVWVDESRRRLGIAESLVRLMIKKCHEEGIVPMYVVKATNHASVSLAKKLGFQVKQRELVIAYTAQPKGVF